MAYNFATDFVGLWRAVTGGVEKGEIPGLDFVVAALSRAGILSPLVVSGSPPVVNQDTTAWFRTATPDYAAEGALYLWDADSSSYLPATPALFLAFLGANSAVGNTFLTIYAVTGVPSNTIGVNGDYALRLDAPGGIYGPKAGGMWPANPLPGTSYSQISLFLDFIGTTQGDIVYRNATDWVVLAPGTAGQLLNTGGPAANPSWVDRSTVVDAGLDLIGSVQGDILYRNATVWTVLAPGAAGQFLQTGGAAANPLWASPSAFALNSAAVDAAFGATAGGVLVRGAAWANSGAGSAGQILTSNGAAAPTFQTFSVSSANLDAAFGSVQGSVLYRNSTVWTALAPGVAGQFLQTAGPAANPAWATALSPSSGGAVGTYALGTQFAGGFDAAGAAYPGTWILVSLYSFGVTDALGNVNSLGLWLRIA